MPELFARHLVMVFGAKAANVLVDILTALCQRDDVIGNGCSPCYTFCLAHAAEGFVPQSAFAQGLTAPAAYPFAHDVPLKIARHSLRSEARGGVFLTVKPYWHRVVLFRQFAT